MNKILFSDIKYIIIDIFIQANFIYLNEFTSNFITSHFGFHGIFFLLNYIAKFPDNILKTTAQIFENIPNNSFVLGVHARIHKPGHYYSRGVNETFLVLSNFLDDFFKTENRFVAIATDFESLFKKIQNRYGDKVLFSNAVRKPDTDHLTALIDMAMLMSCNQVIATYRSTFSFLINHRANLKPLVVEKEAPEIFDLSHSQVTGISPIRHKTDKDSWKTNYIVHLCGSEGQTAALRNYFSYLAL